MEPGIALTVQGWVRGCTSREFGFDSPQGQEPFRTKQADLAAVLWTCALEVLGSTVPVTWANIDLYVSLFPAVSAGIVSELGHCHFFEEEEMGRTCSRHRQKSSSCRDFVRKPEGRKRLGRRKCRPDSNIKIYLS
jgi:hypothetical protein